MEVKATGNGELTVTGVIKTLDDSTELRNAIQSLVDGGTNAINLRIEDSFALPSAVIGHLMKLVNLNKIRLSIQAGDPRLCELFEDLQLTAAFGVTCTKR